MKKKLILALSGLIVGVAALAFIISATLNGKHRVIADEEAVFFVPADELQYVFANDERSAGAKYMDQVIKVSGKVTDVEGHSIVLDNRVLVNLLNDATTAFQEGKELIIKGRCVGFDELLLQVKIDQAEINLK